MWEDEVSERLAIDERKGGEVTSHLSFHTFYTKPDKKITLLSQYLYFPCQMSWLRNASRQIVVAMLLQVFLDNSKYTGHH